MKDNKCDIVFMCQHSIHMPCVYFIESSNVKNKCTYLKDTNKCTSLVAQVNIMVLKIKDIKGDL